MATYYGYNVSVYRFSDGTTTFEVSGDVHYKSGSADGPQVVNRLVANDVGVMIDLDGTGAATLVPPQVTANFIFVASHPDGHSQYRNLAKLAGKHGTLTGKMPGSSANQLVTAPARLMEVKANNEGAHRIGTENWLAVTATWQLKDFWDD